MRKTIFVTLPCILRLGPHAAALALLAALGGGAARGSVTDFGPLTIGNFTFTNSTTETFTTEITARMLGGALLYDQTFSLPVGDPTVQAAILSADAVLTGAGAVFISGPSLISQLTPSYQFTSTVFGPTTVQFGNIGTCQGVDTSTGAPFGCPANTGLSFVVGTGDTEVNTNFDFQTTQLYELDGSTTTPVPEPGTRAMLAVGLIALAGLAWKRRSRARGSPGVESTGECESG